MTGPLTTLAVCVKGPWDLGTSLRLTDLPNDIISPFFPLSEPVVSTVRGYFRYMPTFMWTEVSQLQRIAICHRAIGQVVLIETPST